MARSVAPSEPALILHDFDSRGLFRLYDMSMIDDTRYRGAGKW